MSDIYASFGVNNAIMSGELTEHEEKMISQPIDVRDGDDAISFNVEEEHEINVVQHEVEEPEVEEPEVGRIEINTETGEVEEPEVELEEGSEEEVEFNDVDSADLDSVGAELVEAFQGQEALIQEALGKGLEQASMDSIKAEFEADGKLSEDSYKALEAVGYSKTFVDAYIRGQEAVAAKFAQSVQAYAGGQAQFAKISEFISQDATMTDAFNSALDRNDVTTVKALIDSAKGSLRQSFGVKPQRDITKGAKPAVASPTQHKVEPFGSREEMVKAMADVRYQRDASYRAEVEKRVAISF